MHSVNSPMPVAEACDTFESSLIPIDSEPYGKAATQAEPMMLTMDVSKDVCQGRRTLAGSLVGKIGQRTTVRSYRGRKDGVISAQEVRSCLQ